LEAAPTSGTNAWNDTTTYQWSGVYFTAVGSAAQYTEVGTGYQNTEAIVAQSSTTGKAGTITRAYRGPNNLTDWYLPSKDELNELCKYARQQTTGDTSVACASTGLLRTGFTANDYWSSSEWTVGGSAARRQSLSTGSQSSISKDRAYRVRPVRAF
jgi:hypothetical protein